MDFEFSRRDVAIVIWEDGAIGGRWRGAEARQGRLRCDGGMGMGFWARGGRAGGARGRGGGNCGIRGARAGRGGRRGARGGIRTVRARAVVV